MATYTLHIKGGPGREYLKFQQHFLPRQFGITVDDEEIGPFELELSVEVSSSTGPACTQLAIRAKPGAVVTSKAIRDIPVGRLVRYAIRRAAQDAGEFEAGSLNLFGVQRADMPGLVKATKPPRKARNKLDDDRLEEVATVYRLALLKGDTPTKKVAETFSISSATAGRWVRRARDKGFLGKAIGTKAGEDTQ